MQIHNMPVTLLNLITQVTRGNEALKNKIPLTKFKLKEAVKTALYRLYL